MLRTTLLVLPLLLTGNVVADAQAVGHRVKVNGMQMYYEVSGRGDPLIVLHGAYMNIPMMGAIVPKLAASHRVYALEFQGHGRTTDINRPITYQNLADDVAAFMDAVGLHKADVFGYSMGAIAGLQLAIRHPAKVGKLVFGSGTYDFEGWQPTFSFAPVDSASDITHGNHYTARFSARIHRTVAEGHNAEVHVREIARFIAKPSLLRAVGALVECVN